MMAGRLIAVVGPSGVGKDTVMAGLHAARPGLGIVRRVITRPADLGGEKFVAIPETGFMQSRDRGDFVLHWSAHGLFYGIPAGVRSQLEAGQDLLVNLSRGVLQQAQQRFAGMIVLHLTASPAVLAERLAGRGRETAVQIVARLGRSVDSLPASLNMVTVSNDGDLAQTVTNALRALYPDRG